MGGGGRTPYNWVMCTDDICLAGSCVVSLSVKITFLELYCCVPSKLNFCNYDIPMPHHALHCALTSNYCMTCVLGPAL